MTVCGRCNRNKTRKILDFQIDGRKSRAAILFAGFAAKTAILFAGAVFSDSKASFPRRKSRAAIWFAGFAAKTAILFAGRVAESGAGSGHFERCSPLERWLFGYATAMLFAKCVIPVDRELLNRKPRVLNSDRKMPGTWSARRKDHLV